MTMSDIEESNPKRRKGTVVVNTRISLDLLHALSDAADKDLRTISSFIAKILIEYAREHGIYEKKNNGGSQQT